MPGDSWVGVHERQQSVPGGLRPLLPLLSASLDTTVMLRNITFRSWLRYLFPKIDFWPRQ